MWITWCLGIGLLTAQVRSQNRVEIVEKPVIEIPVTSEPSPDKDFYADSNDCQTFYRRMDVNAPPVRFVCAVGTVFEESKSVCVNPYESTRPQCRTIQASSKILVSRDSPLLEGKTISKDVSVESATSGGVLKCGGAGFIADPSDCRLFYRCVGLGALPVLFRCREGAVFEESLSVCVNPYESSRPQCRSPIPSTRITLYQPPSQEVHQKNDDLTNARIVVVAENHSPNHKLLQQVQQKNDQELRLQVQQKNDQVLPQQAQLKNDQELHLQVQQKNDESSHAREPYVVVYPVVENRQTNQQKNDQELHLQVQQKNDQVLLQQAQLKNDQELRLQVQQKNEESAHAREPYFVVVTENQQSDHQKNELHQAQLKNDQERLLLVQQKNDDSTHVEKPYVVVVTENRLPNRQKNDREPFQQVQQKNQPGQSRPTNLYHLSKFTDQPQTTGLADLPETIESSRDPDFYADESDCRTFYRRMDVGEPILRFDCPDGTVFEESKSVCVHPINSTRPECRESQILGRIVFLDNSQVAPGDDLSLKTSRGVVKCAGTGFIADPDDCQTFYRCAGIGSLPFRFQCQEGAVFEESLSVCVNPFESGRPQCRTPKPSIEKITVYQPLPQPRPVKETLIPAQEPQLLTRTLEIPPPTLQQPRPLTPVTQSAAPIALYVDKEDTNLISQDKELAEKL